jgi:DNA-binding transcriptional LysR family regulator
MDSQVPRDHLEALRMFVRIVELGSLSRAARRAGLTPSAVSKQVSRLEENLGVRLLERTTRSVRATTSGLELCGRLRPLFEALDEATASAREGGAAIRGCVTVTASPALGRTMLMPVLRRLGAEHPGLSFDVRLTGQRIDFFEDGVDLALREGALDDSTLIARRLGEATVMLVASRDYLAKRGTPRRVEDLEDHDLLMVPAARILSDIASWKTGDGRSVNLEPRYRVNDLFALAELAALGAGIAALPDYLAVSVLAEGKLVQVLKNAPAARIPIHAVYPSRRHLPRRVSVVLDALTEAFAAD